MDPLGISRHEGQPQRQGDINTSTRDSIGTPCRIICPFVHATMTTAEGGIVVGMPLPFRGRRAYKAE